MELINEQIKKSKTKEIILECIYEVSFDCSLFFNVFDSS